MEGGGALGITFDNRSIAKGVEFVPLWTGRMGVDQVKRIGTALA